MGALQRLAPAMFTVIAAAYAFEDDVFGGTAPISVTGDAAEHARKIHNAIFGLSRAIAAERKALDGGDVSDG